MFEVTRFLRHVTLTLYESNWFTLLEILHEYEWYPIYYIHVKRSVARLGEHLQLQELLRKYPIYVLYAWDDILDVRYYMYHVMWEAFLVKHTGTIYKLTSMGVTEVAKLRNIEPIFETFKQLCSKVRQNEDINYGTIVNLYKHAKSIIRLVGEVAI